MTLNSDKYNLLFLLTTAGTTTRFLGMNNWIASSDVRLLDSIEFVLCLDGIAESDLQLHLSTDPQEKGKEQRVLNFIEVRSFLSLITC